MSFEGFGTNLLLSPLDYGIRFIKDPSKIQLKLHILPIVLASSQTKKSVHKETKTEKEKPQAKIFQGVTRSFPFFVWYWWNENYNHAIHDNSARLSKSNPWLVSLWYWNDCRYVVSNKNIQFGCPCWKQKRSLALRTGVFFKFLCQMRKHWPRSVVVR